MNLEDIAIRSGYMPHYPTGAATSINYSAQPARRNRDRLFLWGVIGLLLLALLFILGTRPFWIDKLSPNPFDMLWRNLNPFVAIIASSSLATGFVFTDPTPPLVQGSTPFVPAIALTITEHETTVIVTPNEETNTPDTPLPQSTQTATATPIRPTLTPLTVAQPSTNTPTSTQTSGAEQSRKQAAKRIEISAPLPATSTPIPTQRPTPTQTSTGLLTPTTLPKKINNSAALNNLTVTLLQPAEGVKVNGKVLFQWTASAILPGGYGFEVFRWTDTSNRDRGQAMAQPTDQTNQLINLDVLGLDSNLRYYSYHYP
jgi:hypothetical protein